MAICIFPNNWRASCLWLNISTSTCVHFPPVHTHIEPFLTSRPFSRGRDEGMKERDMHPWTPVLPYFQKVLNHLRVPQDTWILHLSYLLPSIQFTARVRNGKNGKSFLKTVITCKGKESEKGHTQTHTRIHTHIHTHTHTNVYHWITSLYS